MFCRGQWEGVQPDDKDLIKYHEWMRATGGQGMALAPPTAEQGLPAAPLPLTVPAAAAAGSSGCASAPPLLANAAATGPVVAAVPAAAADPTASEVDAAACVNLSTARG